MYPKAGLYYAWLEVNCGKKRQNLADVESIRLLHADGCSLSKEGDRLFLDGSGLTDAEELKAEIETQKAMFYLQQQDNEEKENE